MTKIDLITEEQQRILWENYKKYVKMTQNARVNLVITLANGNSYSYVCTKSNYIFSDRILKIYHDGRTYYYPFENIISIQETKEETEI